jgi:hypothetical protein
MSIRLRLLLTAAAVIFSVSTRTAQASIVTDIFTFSVTGETTASGSFTVTFDPTLIYNNDTVDLTVNSFSDSEVSASIPTGFSYAAGTIAFGGILNGTNVDNGGNDFVLEISGVNTSNPDVVLYVSTTASNNNTYVDYSGTATMTEVTSATPEPSSLALFGTGILSLAGVARRRFAGAA